MKKYIGVDLGGTNVRVAIVNEDGQLSSILKTPSYAQEGREKVIDNFKNLIKQLPDYESCAGIGIGLPGACDKEKGCLLIDTNIPGFKDYPIVNDLEETFHMPVLIENDANVAGLGEALFGSGKGYPSIFYITISTGIGGAFILNGQIVSGQKGFGAEIANLIIDPNREKINYLANGAVENEASGTAIIRKANQCFEQPVKHAGEVFAKAKEGNQDAINILQQVIHDIAQLMASISAVVAPHAFVLGGGLMKSKDYFYDKLVAEYQSLVHEELKNTPILMATLDEPGLLGAGFLVHQADKNRKD